VSVLAMRQDAAPDGAWEAFCFGYKCAAPSPLRFLIKFHNCACLKKNPAMGLRARQRDGEEGLDILRTIVLGVIRAALKTSFNGPTAERPDNNIPGDCFPRCSLESIGNNRWR